MARNSENILILRQGMGSFLGMSKAADPQDIHPSKFYDGWNWVCSPKLGEARVRDGYCPIVDNMFTTAFKIMPGARGKLFTPPNLDGATAKNNNQLTYDGLSIGAAPNSGLYVNDDHATQRVTFYVYGGTALGISSYSWTLGDGSTQTGASTSVYRDYTTSGTMIVTVSGVGTDGNTYVASTSIYIGSGIPRVPTEQGDPPTAEILANGEESLELAAAGSATLSWHCSNAATAFLSYQLGGTTTKADDPVATIGSASISVPSGGAAATIRAVSGDGQEVTDSCLIWVNAEHGGGGTSGGGMTAKLLVNGNRQFEMTAPGEVTLSWTTTGASSASIDEGIGAASPLAAGSYSVFVDSTTTFTLTASKAGQSDITDSVVVKVGETKVPGAEYRLQILGTTVADSGESIYLTCAVESRARTSDPWAAAEVTGTVALKVQGDTGVNTGTTPYVGALTLTDAASVTSAAIPLTLRSGTDKATVTFYGLLTVTSAGTIQTSEDLHTIEVWKKSHSFTVECLDSEGSSTSMQSDAMGDGAQFDLKITAKWNGTSDIDTGFSGAVEVNHTITDYGPNTTAQSASSLTFIGAYRPSGGTAENMIGNVIPASVWESGICYVTVRVVLPVTDPTPGEWEAFQDFDFTAKEILT